MSIDITVAAGAKTRLLTAGKYCADDIVITAAGGSGGEEEIPDDGKTRIFIHLTEGRTSPVLGCCPKGTVTIDWGDGTEPDTLTGTSDTVVKYTEPHEYAEPGDYVITLTVDGTFGIAGTSRSKLLGYTSGNSDMDYHYIMAIKKVIVGDNVIKIASNAFSYCCGLSNITILDSVTSIFAYAFSYCYGLSNITIPDSVTGISNNAFAFCYAMRYYDFSGCTDVPALANTSAFIGIADDCEMLIPAALYDEWSTATNWSTYADYMVAV